MGKKSRQKMTDLDEEKRVEEAKKRQEAERKKRIEQFIELSKAATQTVVREGAIPIPKGILVVTSHTVKCKCHTCLWVEDKIMCEFFDENCMNKECEECKEPITDCSDYKDEKSTIKVVKKDVKEANKKTAEKEGETVRIP